VRTMTAEATTVTPRLAAFGRIESRRTLDIRAQVAGEIIELAGGFVEGGTVEAGQFIARIDPAEAGEPQVGDEFHEAVPPVEWAYGLVWRLAGLP